MQTFSLSRILATFAILACKTEKIMIILCIQNKDVTHDL